MSHREKDDWAWSDGMDLGKISEELSRQRPRHTNQNSWEPRIDLIEEEGRIVLKADLAGVRGDDIEVTYAREKNAVLIRGSRMEDADSEQNRVGVFLLEILYGPFEREVILPPIELDTNEMRAIFRHGLLIVLIPKATSAFRKVDIRTS
jgi:HSP20 family protein